MSYRHKHPVFDTNGWTVGWLDRTGHVILYPRDKWLPPADKHRNCGEVCK